MASSISEFRRCVDVFAVRSFDHEFKKIYLHIAVLRIGVDALFWNLRASRWDRASRFRSLQSDGDDGSWNAAPRHDAYPIDECWKRQDLRDPGAIARVPA